jgi:asparagine synthase (glutamine-hydrolysing)
MCGIFCILNGEKKNEQYYKKQFIKGVSRGPEDSKFVSFHNVFFGFHRLAINGIDFISNQPLNIKNIVLICNGEIYNHKYLLELMNIVPFTNSDCEVIIHLYLKYGMKQTLQMLDGVYSFVLYDLRLDENIDNFIYFARDPYGVRPLYLLKNKKQQKDSGCQNSEDLIACASELKCLSEFIQDKCDYEIQQFQPGTYTTYYLSSLACSKWHPIKENQTYFTPNFSHNCNFYKNENIDDYEKNIVNYLCDSVRKRCLNTDRPVACLLSGGLDSSLICALVNHFNKLEFGLEKQIETYSIGLPDSEDLKYAKIVADYLGTKHTEIILTEQEMIDIISEVIYKIESFDTTTVRASIGNYLLGKYISKNSHAKVIFNGDGSDELCGGYLYMSNCPDCIEFDRETRRLLRDIHMFDVLRSDKCISSNGLEPRTPFLDKTFANYYLSIPQKVRFDTNKMMEKFLLRNSFRLEKFQDIHGRQILPDEILWRRKEAFSDGVSNKGRSLYVILQEAISKNMRIENYYNDISSVYENSAVNEAVDRLYPASIETEKLFYKKIFDFHFPNCNKIVPYYWMPKYTNASDPSARTLSLYKTDEADDSCDTNNISNNNKTTNKINSMYYYRA